MTRRPRRTELLVLGLLLVLTVSGGAWLALRSAGRDETRTVTSGAEENAPPAETRSRRRPAPQTFDGTVSAGGPRSSAPDATTSLPTAPFLSAEDADVAALERGIPPDPLAANGTIGRTFVGMGGRVRGPAPVLARVIDEVTNEPIAGALVVGVLLQRDGSVRRGYGSAITTADGKFRMRGIDSGRSGRSEIRVRHMRYTSRAIPAWSGDDIALTPVERATGTLTGSFREAHGGPVRGLMVIRVRDAEFGASMMFVWADEHGAFRVNGLPSGDVSVQSGRAAATTVRIVEGGVARADIETVTRREVADDTRTEVFVRIEHPLARSGDPVRAYLGDDLHWLTTVERGEARFRLPSGDWRVDLPLPDGTHLSTAVAVTRPGGSMTVTLRERAE